VAHVHGEDVAAGLAAGADHVFLHLDDSLRVLALGAEHKLLDEPVEHVLQLAGVVAPVDDVPLAFHVELGLGAELATKVLGHVGGRARQGARHVHHVDQHGLDAVALALHLGLQTGHFVPVEGILDIPIDVESHSCCCWLMLPLFV